MALGQILGVSLAKYGVYIFETYKPDPGKSNHEITNNRALVFTKFVTVLINVPLNGSCISVKIGPLMYALRSGVLITCKIDEFPLSKPITLCWVLLDHEIIQSAVLFSKLTASSHPSPAPVTSQVHSSHYPIQSQRRHNRFPCKLTDMLI